MHQYRIAAQQIDRELFVGLCYRDAEDGVPSAFDV